MFTADEVAALLMAGKLLHGLDPAVLPPAFDQALDRLRAALPEHLRDLADRLDRRLFLGEVPGSARESTDPAMLSAIQLALAENRVLDITYPRGGTGPVEERQVEALGLIRQDGRWHLVAWCRQRQAFRQFRLDRIQSARPRNEQFLPESHDPSVVGGSGSSTVPGLTRVRLRFRAGAETASFRNSWLFGYLGQRDTTEGPELDFLMDSPEQLCNWLFPLGNAVRVIEPSSLRDELVRRLATLADFHQSDGC